MPTAAPHRQLKHVPPNPQPRILIVRVGAMGDVLHALPAVSALRGAMPEAEIGWAIEPRWITLLRSESAENPQPRTLAMPLVDTIHEVPARAWLQSPFSRATRHSVLALRRELRSREYDIAIDLQGSIRSAVIARMSGAARIVGADAPREHAARLLYNRRVASVSGHVVEQAAEIVSAALGMTLSAAPAPLPVDARAEQWCETLLLLAASHGIVVLAPSAGWGAKQWPAERYGVVARALAEAGYRVLVNAAGDKDQISQQVLHASAGAAEISSCSLSQLTSLLRRTSLVIAGDTGPLHLAAALGRPILGLFGPTDPLRTGPYGTFSHVLRHESSVTDHRRHPESEAGLQRISVDEVLSATHDLLRSSA